MKMEIGIARNAGSAREAFEGAGPGRAIYGITDGSWSLIDALRELLVLCGPAELTLAVWTAASADLREAERMLRARNLRSVRLIVDRSFPSRQPRYSATARKLFGDDAIRLWNSHAKFAVVRGEKRTALFLTSANLNRNRRVETFSLYFSPRLAAEYLALVDRLYVTQGAGEGFAEPSVARAHTEECLRDV